MDDHTTLYQLIIGQLRDDGFHKAAQAVSSSAMVIPPEPEQMERNQLAQLLGARGVQVATKHSSSGTADVVEESLDLESEWDGVPISSSYATSFITTHKSVCRIARFSPNGQYVATASSDCSIKLLDVERIKVYAAATEGGATASSTLPRPVVRTYYDHNEAVNDVSFHPNAEIFASCGRDKTIKFYDYSDQSKRAFRAINDSHSARTVHFHPSGDFLIGATDHSFVRLYDVATFTTFTSPHAGDHHYAAVTCARYASNGKHFASSSKDGSIRIYDTVTHRCVQYIPAAHMSCEVSSVEYSSNSNYLISSGKDGTARVWDIRACRQVKCFGKADATGRAPRSNCTLSTDQNMLLHPDPHGSACLVYNIHTGEVIQRLHGHNGAVKHVAVSPTERAVVTCSVDYRARFWFEEKR